MVYDPHSEPWDIDDEGSRLVVLAFERIVAETPDAWLLDFGMNEEDLHPVEHWLPKSQCDLLSDTEIEVPEWLVLEKGIDEYET